MAAATIRLFLPKGDAQSLRTAELLNWTGKAVAGPRSELDDLLSRDEMEKSGVYFLIGVDRDSGKPAAYIGEAEVVRDRLKQHRDKEFWVQAIAFVSKDENLTKSHIRYLEGRLIEEAQKVGRFIVINNQSSGSRLPESDREDMEVFLTRIRQLLPVLGCDILTPLVQTVGGVPQKPLIGRIKGLNSRGQRTGKGFVVFAGSEAVVALRPSAPSYVAEARSQLKADGTLVEDADKLRFTRDTEFSSPSLAGAIICGGHVNGLTFWKDEDGRNLKEIEGGS
ncbi:MAG: GIY-YIG nuclease family protein [Verrucomicrobiae bacterium]|nr:GIY-YIG nuclease family protein [Verrucomicrobiae bacterium]